MHRGAWQATAHGLEKNITSSLSLHPSQPPPIDFEFSSGLNGKESVCSAGDPGLIPGSGRCPGEGNDNPFQYSYLENPMDRGAWWPTVHGIDRVGHDWVTNTLTQDHLSFRMWQLQSAGFTESFKNNTHVFWWQAWSPSLFYPGLTLGWEDLLEKETATFSSILAGKIPWMEDPGRLQFMGSQTVQHYWATSLKKLSDLDKIQARASLRPQSFFSVLSPNDLLNVVFHLQIFTDFPAVN